MPAADEPEETDERGGAAEKKDDAESLVHGDSSQVRARRLLRRAPGSGPATRLAERRTAGIREETRNLRIDSSEAHVIPGGCAPDTLRLDRDLVAFVRDVCATSRLVAAVCRGRQLLIEGDAVAGGTLTSRPPVRWDLENAGANRADGEVVIDGNLHHLAPAGRPAGLPRRDRGPLGTDSMTEHGSGGGEAPR